MIKQQSRKALIITVLLGTVMIAFYFIRLNLIAYYAFIPDADFASYEKEKGFEEIWIEQGGVKRHALLIRAGNENSIESKNQVILYLHGNSGNVYSRQHIAQQLNQKGYDVLLLEYSGYGKSEGKATEPAIYRDAEVAFDYLLEELGYAKKQIVIMGRSIGTTAAVDVAQGRQLAAVILVSPLYSGYEIAKTMNMSILTWGAIGSFDNAAKVKNIVVPVMIIHGDNDDVTPLNFGTDLFNELLANKNLFRLVKGAEHNGLFEHAGSTIWEEIDAFIQASLEQQ